MQFVDLRSLITMNSGFFFFCCKTSVEMVEISIKWEKSMVDMCTKLTQPQLIQTKNLYIFSIKYQLSDPAIYDNNSYVWF
jgi:hypothetical protein